MARIKVTTTRVEEIVVDHHLVPCGDEIDVDIVRDLKITVHSQETRKRAVERVVEGDSIKRIQRGVAKEELAVRAGDIDCGIKTTGQLCCGAPTTAGKCVSTDIVASHSLITYM